MAAAVILNPSCIPDGLDDSKRLSAEQREALFATILGCATAISMASVSAEGIDRPDIRKARLDALADGRDVPPGLPCHGKAVVKGDQRSQSIAAASIVAKVMRDRMMSGCGGVHVSYGFESHMGYATARHRAAIETHGPVARLHRISFAPFSS